MRWLRPEHLDLPPELFDDARLATANEQLLKMDQFKAPRDKLICILNCCKILYSAPSTRACFATKTDDAAAAL